MSGEGIIRPFRRAPGGGSRLIVGGLLAVLGGGVFAFVVLGPHRMPLPPLRWASGAYLQRWPRSDGSAALPERCGADVSGGLTMYWRGGAGRLMRNRLSLD